MSDSDDPAVLDAVLHGDHDDDIRDLSVFADDLVAAYVADDELEQGPALRRFTRGGAVAPVPASPVRRRWSRAAAAVVGTVAGKVALGSAVAVAAVGGLHATDTVDVPFLPDTAPHDDSEGDVDRPVPSSEPPSSPSAGAEPSPAPAADPAGSSAPTAVDEVPNPADPADRPEGGPAPDAEGTIPAPTVPPTTAPDTTPPILDPDELVPGPTVPEPEE